MGILTDKMCLWFWDELNHRVRRTEAIPATQNQNYVQRYVTSMRRHCLAVVNSAGGHTRY